MTFHATCNHGALLQAYALQTTLEKMGHRAWIVKHVSAKRQSTAYGPFARPLPIALLTIAVCTLAGCAKLSELRRLWRAAQFRKRFLHRTPYSFISWKAAQGVDLGLDALVVGSDQVWRQWRPGEIPHLFLLTDAPRELGAIAYAASFGNAILPESTWPAYREGLRRFSAISVRERSGAELVRFWWQRHFTPHVRFQISAGPREFVRSVADAEWVATSSFHGFMFATIFKKNVRVFGGYGGNAPDSFFTRVLSFAETYIHGPVITESVEAGLDSLTRGEQITFDDATLEADRARSLAWLRDALAHLPEQ